MGYYSEVAIVLSSNAMKAVDERASKSVELRALLDMADTVKNKDACRMYIWNGIKWYDKKGIDEIENCLGDINGREFLYCIIGDNLEDITERGLFWENPFRCRILRCIEFDD